MAEYKEAKAEKRSYKKLAGMHIMKGANGGHSITHHYKGNGMAMEMPKEHNFGPEDAASGATHAHIMTHLKSMGIQGGEQTAEAMPETQEAEA